MTVSKMDRKRSDWKKRSFFSWRYVPNESRRAYRLALILFGSIWMYFFFERYVVNMGIVTDQSMRPTLREHQYCIVQNYIYRFTKPNRGDIVVVQPDSLSDEHLVKRIVGLGGETFEIVDGDVYINGQQLAEPYAIGPTQPNLGPFRIEEEAYFVMGDNRLESEDSRHFGSIPLKNIRGKVRQ